MLEGLPDPTSLSHILLGGMEDQPDPFDVTWEGYCGLDVKCPLQAPMLNC